MSLSSENTCIAKFLDDRPCSGPSAFGIHEAVASAISKEIEYGEPSNIAIIGDWGSGKSTVLARIDEKLNSESVMFHFDAWAHSGDSLRKSFLLSLGEKLVSASSDRESSEDELNKIKSEIDGTTTVTHHSEKATFPPLTSSLMFGVGIFAFTQVLCAAFVSLLSVSPIDVFPNISSYDFISNASSFLSLSFALLSAVFIYLKREKAHPEKYDGVMDELTYFFGKKPITTTIKQEERAAILDSLAFESYYRSLLESPVLIGKKLVIAFDNIDRLRENELHAAWNTLQVFAGDGEPIKNATTKPWVLLPISRTVFNQLDSSGGEGVISKVFIRSFEIPTPISTDWKTYFINLTAASFPKASEKDLQLVYAIASRALLKAEKRVPRNAKQFINEMVSQMLVYHSVDLVSIAVFCYLRRCASFRDEQCSFMDFMISIIGGNSEYEHFISLIETDAHSLRDDLAMMTFGQFSAAKASEVYVSSVVSKAIRDQTGINVDSIIGDRLGAWDLLYAEIEKELGMGSDRISNEWICRFIASFNREQDESSIEDCIPQERILKLLLSALTLFRYPQCADIGKPLTEVLSKCSKTEMERVSSLLFEGLSRIVSENEDEYSDFVFDGYVFEMNMMLRGLVNNPNFSKSMFDTFPDLGFCYGRFVLKSAILGGDNTWLCWIDAVDPESFCSLINTLEYIIDFEDNVKTVIDVANMTNTLNAEKFDGDCFKHVLDSLGLNDSVQRRVEIKLLLWVAKNCYGLSSNRVAQLYDYIHPTLEEYATFTDLDEAQFKGSLLAILLFEYLSTPSDEILLFIDNNLCDSDSISFVKSTKKDFFKCMFNLMTSVGNTQVIERILELAWTEEENYRPLSTYFEYVDSVSKTVKRKNLGNAFARTGRNSEILTTQFEIHRRSFYLGAFEIAPSGDLVDWFFQGLMNISVGEWKSYFKRGSNDSLFQLLLKIDGSGRSIPRLEQSVVECIADGTHSQVILQGGLLTWVKDDGLLKESFTQAVFAQTPLWKNVVNCYGAVMLRINWLGSIALDQRLLVLKMVLDSNASKYCEWLEEAVMQGGGPRRLFYSRLKQVKNMLNRSCARKSMADGGKRACERIIDLL